ncbi:hypothetical protein E1B28_012121 [Marasmius oreades]|uniref:DNA polymerase n=1 Tax=Marasmius oreades TaxID=181124 RepID=A0A9P7RR07_9AGAR|nr:uncharacterized protein E1B28_012121 [Marasmius oreades]KAG7088095.1 hypothetical protein E1B28_012121 [Marasmius oreades]
MLSRALQKKPFVTGSANWNSVRRSSNDAILKMLRHCQETEKSRPKRNLYRLRAFRKAITTIEGMDKPITSANEIAKVEGIGRGIRNRIQTLLDTGDLETAVSEDSQKQRLRDALGKVPFLGPTTIAQLIEAGCSSVYDIQRPKLLALLKPKQRVGIKYLQQLALPVSLVEAEKVKDFIQQTIPPDYQILLCGTHRRAHPSPESITLLLIHASQVYLPLPEQLGPPDPNNIKIQGRGTTYFRARNGYTKNEERTRSSLLQHIMPRLQDRGLIADTTKDHMWKWTGIVRVPERGDADEDIEISAVTNRKRAIEEVRGRFVRLEINLAPQKSLGAATIALTGDNEFIRTVQRQAAKMGMLLNEFGLWKWMPYNNTSAPGTATGVERGGSWRLMPSDSEEVIFAELGMEYVPPEKRGYLYLVQKQKRKGLA